MPSKAELIEKLEQMASMLELTGANRFKVNAYDKAARAIKGASIDVIEHADDPKKLEEIDGVGSSIAEKIGEFAETGTFEEFEQLRKKVPSGLIRVLAVPGIGPKTVRLMWTELEIETIDDLKKAIDDGSLEDLPRMGKKTIENLKDAISFSEQSGERTPIGKAMPLAEDLVEKLGKVKGVRQIAYAGSLRRGAETIGDIDILVSAKTPADVHDALTGTEGVEKVLASGETKTSVRMKLGNRQIQVDLRSIDDNAFGAAMLYFTGSKEHNVKLRERALKKDLTLNEYGLFPEDDEDTPPQQRGVKPVACDTEEKIYKALDLKWIPPELREDRGELKGKLPDLLELDDIKAELHAHTTESDGAMSIRELAEHAKQRGFHTIAVTDHSKSSAVANGLDEKRLRKHIKAVREVNDEMDGITILAGSEVDILADGRLDYDDELLAELDIVVASPHTGLSQDPKKATSRLLKAIEHPLVHILGHPTGRLIGKREGLSPDIKALAEAAEAHNVALEVNANWRRLDLRDTHIAIALEAGALIAIDCDVHGPADYDQLRYGVLTARRGGLAASSCVNTWTAAKLQKWLKSKR
jgi:DNA polymerase (family 10)